MRPAFLQATTTCSQNTPCLPGFTEILLVSLPCWLGGEITINLGGGAVVQAANQSLHAQLFKFLRRKSPDLTRLPSLGCVSGFLGLSLAV